jgi:hypothetical protein
LPPLYLQSAPALAVHSQRAFLLLADCNFTWPPGEYSSVARRVCFMGCCRRVW